MVRFLIGFNSNREGWILSFFLGGIAHFGQCIVLLCGSHFSVAFVRS